MRYPDVVRLATVTSDGYGDKTVTAVDEIPASFIKKSGMAHGANTEGETSDATVYLSPANSIVLAKKDDLDGMYIHAQPFSDNSWYKISSSSVAERKLLNNAIDNIHCSLEKVAGLAYVLVS